MAACRLLATLTLALLSPLSSADSQFASITAPLCIRSEFLETHASVKSPLDCSLLCYRRRRCQAFSLAGDSACKLMVFDKCSKGVRDCSCTRYGEVFVRQQPGLSGGALCPAGFSDDLCGSKYKLYPGGQSFLIAKATIDAEPGLVIMADVTDNSELAHLQSLHSKNRWPNYLLLGGRQSAGSAEPGGGWYWVSCNISLSGNSSLWNSGEPSNSFSGEEVTNLSGSPPKLNDGSVDSIDYVYVLAECVSPFG